MGELALLKYKKSDVIIYPLVNCIIILLIIIFIYTFIVFCMFFYAPVLTQSVLLAVPFLAEGFAFAANVDKPLNFISFFGAIFALVGIFKIYRGDRQRRAIMIREQLLE